MTARTAFILAALFAVAGASQAADPTSAPSAPTQWQKDHPRRAEVNKRLANQNDRIDDKVAAGDMSKQEAHKLHRQDHAIRKEERLMAAQNNGHITKTEQKTLNQQENKVSKEIAK